MAQTRQAVLDGDIREAVLARIAHEPKLKESRIDIEVEKGLVTLKGFVERNGDKLTAERAAIGVGAVRGVADLLETRHPRERSDQEILEDVFRALNSNIALQADRIKVTVANSKVTLEGTVNTPFQKLMAESAVKRIHGISGVLNNLFVAPSSTVSASFKDIEQPGAAVDEEAALD